MLGASIDSVNDSPLSFVECLQIIGRGNYVIEFGGASEYRHGSIEYDARP